MNIKSPSAHLLHSSPVRCHWIPLKINKRHVILQRIIKGVEGIKSIHEHQGLLELQLGCDDDDDDDDDDDECN